MLRHASKAEMANTTLITTAKAQQQKAFLEQDLHHEELL
jgi:hypothetical protein